MALGEDVDPVDAAELERLLPLLLAEARADIRDVLGGVEVQVNLAGEDGEHMILQSDMVRRGKGAAYFIESTISPISSR